MTNLGNRLRINSNKLKSFFSERLVSKKTVILVFALFFICGMLVFKDYGISFDETHQRNHSIVNYVHVFGSIMRGSEHETVRAVAESTPALETYGFPFHESALQAIPVFIEHLFNFELGDRAIFLIRHAFVFINYFFAGICFYIIIKRRFGNTVLPLLGALAFILYPRFFAEAFYNIKDNLFFSWIVISGYFILRWLESGGVKWTIISGLGLAIATSTRILGISLLLLACAFAVIIAVRQKASFLAAAVRPLALVGATIAFWVLITPYLWENPIKRIFELFSFYRDYEAWDGFHLYMGAMITRHVPWHYIPVWMGVTVPLPYIAMFIVGTACVCKKAYSLIKHINVTPHAGDRKRNARKGESPGEKYAGLHLYDLFFTALFYCTLLGFIALQISMYEGWRHAYGIYFPFLYIAVYGLDAAITFVQKKRVLLRRVGGCAVFACFAFLLGWIIVNHPNQYVYFNSVGRLVAERNFALDYWEVSHSDLLRYALANDSRTSFAVNGFDYHINILKEAETKRIIWTVQRDKADYYLQNTRDTYDSRVAPGGFEEAAAIKVDGMTISKLYKSKAQPQVELDGYAWDYIESIETSMRRDIIAEMHDHKLGTRWTSSRVQQPGDFLLFKFDRPVNYDFFCMEAGYSPEDHPEDIAVHVSADANSWKEMRYSELLEGYRFEERPEPYQFIVFEARAPAPGKWWSIHELYFGHTIN